MKRVLGLIFISIFSHPLFAQQLPSSKYQKIKGDNFVQSKNYYFLTLLQKLPDVNKLISSDEVFSKIAAEKSEHLKNSLSNCGNDVGCYLKAVEFNESEIAKVGSRIKTLYNSQKYLKDLVQNQLIPSRAYLLYANLSPQNMLQKAWEQDARAINYAIEVYAGGKLPNYPNIDSISFNVKNKAYPSLLYDCTKTIVEETKDNQLFFMPSLLFALQAIEINDRDRAADYEPMERNCNQKSFNLAKNIKWNDYPYSVILVPGAGPDDPAEAISATGKLRCKVAAIRWKEKKAPFIMVSGGKVHPYQTKYCEAEEMKKYLRESMDIPESAIIMEPHARHTTTNMRNCVRLMYQYGMPIDKPAITSTTKSQSYYITNSNMQQRCIKELGYSPYRNGKRLSETEAEFYLVLTALQTDADEPMDP